MYFLTITLPIHRLDPLQFLDCQTGELRTKLNHLHSKTNIIDNTLFSFLSFLLTRMMSMYNSLMKRYEKELKTNTRHMETIATLNVRIVPHFNLWIPVGTQKYLNI